MLRAEVFLLVLVAVVFLVAGLAWSYGPIVFFVAAFVLGALALFVNIKE